MSSAQARTDIEQLIPELRNEEMSDQAALQILAIASHDQDARRIAAPALLEIIQKSHGRAWLNSIRLAGDLKIDQALPALVEMLKNPMTKGGPITFYDEYTLADDPPGHALARIGAPAIPNTIALLESRDWNTRCRAVLVLGNMDLPSADIALERHSLNEKDHRILFYIQGELREHRSAAKPK